MSDARNILSEAHEHIGHDPLDSISLAALFAEPNEQPTPPRRYDPERNPLFRLGVDRGDPPPRSQLPNPPSRPPNVIDR